MDFKADIFTKKLVTRHLENKPLIFWDTCAMLDVLRVADKGHNPRMNTSMLESYERIVELIEMGKLVSITSEMVRHELEDNYDVAHQVLDGIEKYCVDGVVKYAKFSSNTNAYASVQESVRLINSKVRIEELLNRLCKNTYIIKEQKTIYGGIDVSKAARDRVLFKMPPASKKQEYKDCYIWMTFVSVAKCITSHRKTIFLTSNKEDFMDESTGKPHSRLNSDIIGLENVEILFDPNLARHELETVE